MHVPHRIAAGFLAGSLLLATAGGAFAAAGQTGHGKFGFGAGQVSNLTDTGFTLTWTPKSNAQGTTPAAKTLQVTITAQTKERARRGTTGPLVAGDYALVLGKKSGTTIAAQRILYSSTPFNGHRQGRVAVAKHVISVLSVHRAAGSVTASSSTSLTIQTKSGKTLVFSITTATRFSVSGKLQTAAPTFTTGQHVIVRYVNAQQTKTHIARTIIA